MICSLSSSLQIILTLIPGSKLISSEDCLTFIFLELNFAFCNECLLEWPLLTFCMVLRSQHSYRDVVGAPLPYCVCDGQLKHVLSHLQVSDLHQTWMGDLQRDTHVVYKHIVT